MDYLLCADWSKEQKGRALFAADVKRREVRRIAEVPLTIDTALARAREFAKKGNVLLSFDLPLGLPHSFLVAARKVPGWEAASSFTYFLPLTSHTPTFFASGNGPHQWGLQQPFFTVPPGTGSKLAFYRAAARSGVRLRRHIDKAVGGNPVFITAGLPGSVGSAAIDAWKILADLLPRTRDFKVWPFEGTLPALFASAPIVIAENYPRAIYAAALSDVSGASRSRLKLPKTRPETRYRALKCLLSRRWVAENAVTILNTEDALADENQFDALITAAGLLRLVVEGEPLCSPAFEDPIAEGGIWGSGTIRFDLPEADFTSAGATRPCPVGMQRQLRESEPILRGAPGLSYHCPIPECEKVFVGSRGGWDGHVGAFRMHPNWQSQVTDYEARLRAFRTEYAEFFD